MKITRIKTPWPIYEENDRHYSHPNGWRIVRCERDWSVRGQKLASFDSGAGAKTWWEVYPLALSPRQRQGMTPVFDATTLRECRTWCDDHTWSYRDKRAACLTKADLA